MQTKEISVFITKETNNTLWFYSDTEVEVSRVTMIQRVKTENGHTARPFFFNLPKKHSLSKRFVLEGSDSLGVPPTNVDGSLKESDIVQKGKLVVPSWIAYQKGL